MHMLCADPPVQSDSEIPEDKELIRRLSVEKIRQHGGEFSLVLQNYITNDYFRCSFSEIQ